MNRLNNCFRLFLLIAVFAAYGTPAKAQLDTFNADLFGKTKVSATGEEIRYEAKIVPTQARAGEEVTLQLTATVAEGWHTFSLTQSPFGGSPTVIRVSKSPGLTPLGSGFVADRKPHVREEKIGDAEFVFEEYEGQVTFSRRFRVAADASPGETVVAGTVKYQVCENVCITGEQDFQASLKILPGAAPAVAESQSTELEIRAATWNVSVQPSTVPPGGTATLSVALDLKPSWHAYGMDQQKLADGSGPGLPTAIVIDEQPGLILKGDSFTEPAPHVGEDPALYPGLKILMHEGHVVWTRQIEVPADAELGEVPISGRIGYLICTDKNCDQPTGLTFRGKLTVGEETVETPAAFSLAGPLKTREVIPFVDAFAAARTPVEVPEDTMTAEGDTEKPVVPQQERALIPFLLTAFTAGFLALLTPCVFPMVPITVSFFLKQSEKEHHRPISTALIYCLGIVGTFTVLGIAMSMIFGAASLNQLVNNPWINLSIAAVLVFFGANLLGLFEIRIPSWLLTFSSGQQSRGGIAGVLFMALTFTLTSFTCTFAFVGLLLVQATQGAFYWPIIGLIAFSAAFSLPFFFLALFPSLLKKLPKSGGWMNTIKVTMGLVELGAAFKFLSVADIAWFGMPWIFDYHLVMSAWMIIAVTAGIYLLGMFQLPHDSPTERIGVLRLFFAMSFLGLGSYLAVGLFGSAEPQGGIWENIAAFAPPRFEAAVPDDHPMVAGGGAPDEERPAGPFLTHDGLNYSLDFDRAIEFAAEKNQLLFLDFTGVNCVNCRKMEATVLNQPQIKERLRKMVRVQLFADVVPTVADRAESQRILENNIKLQQNWFGDVTLPAYAVITPDRKILSSTGGLQSANKFAAFLDQGVKQWQDIANRDLARRR